jgi:hypothetical protein
VIQVKTDAALRTFPPFIRWALVATALTVGAGYAIGPPSLYSSTSFDILKGITWFPIPAWGIAFMACGFLMSTTKLIGYALGVMTWGTWGLGLALAGFEGKLAGWGGPIYSLFIVAICGYEVFRWGQRHLIEIRDSNSSR